MRRLRGGALLGPFAPGYAAILTGEGGLVTEPVDAEQQHAALNHKARTCVNRLLANGSLGPSAHAFAFAEESTLLNELRAFMDNASKSSVARARLAEVESRLAQLGRVQQHPKAGPSLVRKLAKLNTTLEESISSLQEEAKTIRLSFSSEDMTDLEYESFLRAQPSPDLWTRF
jgi:hypothetical protein